MAKELLMEKIRIVSKFYNHKYYLAIKQESGQLWRLGKRYDTVKSITDFVLQNDFDFSINSDVGTDILRELDRRYYRKKGYLSSLVT